MVSESEMNAGYFGFRHMAGYAGLPAYAAYLALCVAGEALLVITRSFVARGCVGAVTGSTGNAAVRGVVAFAVGQTIGLEANVQDALRSVGGDLFPGTMTDAAEVRDFFSRFLRQAGHPGMRSRMCSGSGMAMLALYAGCYRFGLVVGVAVEAATDFGGINHPPRCFFEVAARAIEVTGCEVK